MSIPNKKDIFDYINEIGDIDGIEIYSTMSKEVDIHVEGKLNDKVYSKIIKKLSKKYEDVYRDTSGKNKFVDIGIRPFHRVNIIVDRSPTRVTTEIQETGTKIVFNAVLKNKNLNKFDNEESILGDEKLMNKLRKIFPNDRTIKSWVHTYYEQQKEFFDKFRNKDWDEFDVDGKDFVSWISEKIKNVAINGIQPVGKYTGWSPADIWAVKNGDQVKKEIEDTIGDMKYGTLAELNDKLRELISESRLVGISLKKIKNGSEADFKYFNVDLSKAVLPKEKNITEIDFEISMESSKDEGIIAKSEVNYENSPYVIYVGRAGNTNDTNIKVETNVSTSGARGGAAPKDMVIKTLKEFGRGVSFKNEYKLYPSNSEDFLKMEAKFKSFYDRINSKVVGVGNYEEFKKKIVKSFDSQDPKKIDVARSKLMQIHFFHDTMSIPKNKQKEFWIDILYLSLKVNRGKNQRFAPHGKIS
jgi:hypothetical protein